MNDADDRQAHTQSDAQTDAQTDKEGTPPLEPPPSPRTIPSAIIGLGNPGGRYANTRHNAGFMVLDELAKRWRVEFRQQREFYDVKVAGVVLVKPQTFMNASGKVVQRYASQHKHLLVVHDDLDLPLGRLRFKFGGGAGGQRGVQDSINRIGKDFYRLKVGISRPPDGWAVERWVLSRFADEEKDLLEQVISSAADAIEQALERGIERTMGDVNGRDLRPAKPETRDPKTGD